MVPTERSAAVPSRPLDAGALAHQRRRLLRGAAPPWLHGEVARRMAERLPVIRLQPRQVADWGAALGASSELLRKAYPQAQLWAVDTHLQPSEAPAWWSPQRWLPTTAPRRVQAEDLQPGQVQLLWANMALQWSADPPATLRRWQRALAVDGFVMFSTLGPGSLALLREVYEQEGWPPPFAPFVDMHDFGDMLLEAGFADPVMDQEQLTLTWPNAQALLDELRGLGGNSHTQRHGGLRTPRWRQRLVRALQARADAQGRIALGFEVVYGHAFKVAVRPRVAAETTLPLEDMRAMVRAGRRPV